jgi:hypothetical protein
MSILNVPNLHDSEIALFSILIFTKRPLALVSFLVVLDVIVNGLREVAVSDCCGYRLTAKVTNAFPCKSLKSGTNLLTAKNTSPDIAGPVA